MPIGPNPEDAVIFLGLAEHVQESDQPFPYGTVDLYQITQHKHHIIYPAVAKNHNWVFLVSTDFASGADLTKWELRVNGPNGNRFGQLGVVKNDDSAADHEAGGPGKANDFKFVPSTQFQIVWFSIDALAIVPGIYTIESAYDKTTTTVGSVELHYKKAPALTADAISAIESNPRSLKTIRMDFGCKHCQSKLLAYTGLRRSPDLEGKGYTWYEDLPDEFRCTCNTIMLPLSYLRESMHGLLLENMEAKLRAALRP